MIQENQLLQWVENQKSTIDQIIYEAGELFFEHNRNKDNFAFELEECQSESFFLVEGEKDLCYDRYCTPFVYSLWYQARRVNTFLRFFTSAMLKSQNEPLIEIFDLGAGTGAVQFAVGLVYLGMNKLGLKPPKVRVINIDTSPFMLSYNKEYLWRYFLKYYPILNGNPNFQVEYEVNSWNVNTEKQATNPWLTASYLFDISDNEDIIAEDFIKLIKQYSPTTILLLTSWKKKTLLKKVSDSVKTKNYRYEGIHETSLLFKGNLDKVNDLRQRLNQHYLGKGLNKLSTWHDNSFAGVVLRKEGQQSFNLINASIISNIDLFNPKIRIRKDLKLSNQQKQISEFLGRPSIIVGPAGSGKSVVISEKVKYIAEKHAYDPKLKILVSSFNKGLIKKLGEWIDNLLTKQVSREEISPEACVFTFPNSAIANITVMHFDLLPTRLGGITGHAYQDGHHLYKIERIINDYKNEKQISQDRFDKILNAEFLYKEFYRIFYGLNIQSKQDYLAVGRRGMGQGINQEQREVIFECIKRYMKFIHENQQHSFITRRRDFLKKIKADHLSIKYDYILIDEFQDCTPADFEIFFRLVKNINNLTFAGDLAQAIHIGKSADVPRRGKIQELGLNFDGNFSLPLLKGSYRLPQRITECISSLSKEIVTRWQNHEAAKEIEPAKNSPPGARPIIVYASTPDSMSQKIRNIFELYKIYGLSKITILEKDEDFRSSLHNMGMPSEAIETDTILKLKGLEKDCVLWSTRRNIDNNDEVYEFVYTILTRTSSILIIALFDSMPVGFKDVISQLNKDKLILWDNETKQNYSRFCT